MMLSRKAIFWWAIVLMIICGSYVWVNRYYFRFLPIPLSFVDKVNNDSVFSPSHQDAEPMGSVAFPMGDLTSDEGLRRTLDTIQFLSPFSSADGLPKYNDLTFEKWLKRVKESPMFCTDGSQLFILAAWSQGLMAREWHLLPRGWPPGQGHSVAEFFNPVQGKWQLVDAQHAGIVRDTYGKILSMSDVLIKYSNGERGDIVIDYGEYKDQMLNGARGPSTEQYFFDYGLLDTPVLQLRQATWFAKTPKVWGLSGHLIIGYPIMMEGLTHNSLVYLTKLVFIGFFVFGGIAAFIFSQFFGQFIRLKMR